MKGHYMIAKNPKNINAEEFDKIFDEGNEDILQYCDVDNAIKRINVDFPIWMIKEFDEEAKKLGINRQAIIKTWLKKAIDEKKILEIQFKKGLAG